jgi:hypothetical protein
MTATLSEPMRYHSQPRADQLLSSGVDWITCTQEHGKEGKLLYAAAAAAVDEEESRGNDVKQGMWQGYDITRCGGAMVGMRADTVVAQLTGSAADAYWSNLLPHARNVSRLDFQCTGRYRPAMPALAWDSYRDIPERPFDRGRPRGCGIIAHKTRGDTLMLGSRASAAYGRHYDKGVESGEEEPGRIWRWEIELKRDIARSTAISMAGMEDPSPFITSQVWSWFWKWGLKPGFRPLRHLYTG